MVWSLSGADRDASRLVRIAIALAIPGLLALTLLLSVALIQMLTRWDEAGTDRTAVEVFDEVCPVRMLGHDAKDRTLTLLRSHPTYAARRAAGLRVLPVRLAAGSADDTQTV